MSIIALRPRYVPRIVRAGVRDRVFAREQARKTLECLRAPRTAVVKGVLVRVGASSSVVHQANATILARAPEWNMAQRHIALAIGMLETDFGVSGSWLFDDGTPSYNWGGLVGSGTNGYISHDDVNPDGSPHEGVHFKAFNNMADAFDAFRATWTHGDIAGIGHPEVAHEPTVGPAAARGDAHAVATTMYAHGYFGGTKGTAADRINLYAQAIVNAEKQIAGMLGEPVSASLSSSSSGGVPRWGWALVAASTIAIFYLTFRGVVA